MPACREMSELATDYFDHALPWRRAASVRWHLLQCSACRAYYDQFRKLGRLLRHGPLPGPSAEVEATVLATARGGAAQK